MAKKYLFIISLIIISILITSSPIIADSDDESDKFSYTAIIPQGGHYKTGNLKLDEGDKIEGEVNVLDGGNVDVYLMVYTQYTDAYNTENESRMIISYLKADENEKVTTLSFKVPDSNDDDSLGYFDSYINYEMIYVIIDNRNCSLTPDDANAIGPVKVTVDIEITRAEPSRSFEEINDSSMFGCCIIIVIIIIVIIIIIVFIFHDHHHGTGAQYWPQYQSHYQTQYQPPPQPYYQYPLHQYQQYHYHSYQHPQYQYYNPYYYQYPYWQTPEQQQKSTQTQIRPKTKKRKNAGYTKKKEKKRAGY